MSTEYPGNWKEIATAVKDAAGWRCIRCGHPHDTHGVIECDDQCDLERHSESPRRMLTYAN